MARSYESNGPDVKIRGTASHIADKYMQLARDAQSSGDPVAAENYFQHAEHYFRVIAAAQAHTQQQGQIDPQRPRFNGADDVDGDDIDEMPPFARSGAPQPVYHQPGIETPAEAEDVGGSEQPAVEAEAFPGPGAGEGAPAQPNGGHPRRRRRRSSADGAPQAAGEAAGAKGANGSGEHDADGGTSGGDLLTAGEG